MDATTSPSALRGTAPAPSAKPAPQQERIEAEMDRAIAQLAARSERAMAEGDPQGAREFSNRMYDAIASRTPEHVARLEAEALQRLDESTFQGRWTAELASSIRRAAASGAAVRRRVGGLV